MSHVTLDKYFQEAQVQSYPAWFSEIKLELFDALGNPSKPRWHQVTGLNFCFNQMRTGLMDEQGTGKTLVSQAFAVWNAGSGNPTICVMPPVLIGQYYDSLISTFKGIENKLKIVKYKGPLSKRQELLQSEDYPDILIMSYDIFLKDWKNLKRPDCLILDECKVIGNPNSKTCEAIVECMGEYDRAYALLMNGTPANNMLSDLYGYIKFLQPWVYVSRLHFDNLHVEYKKVPVRLKEGKIRDTRVIERFLKVDLLFKNFFGAARRVEKSQVLELPAKNFIPVTVELDDKHYYRYKRFFEERLLEFSDGSILDGTASSSLRQIAMQSVMRPDILGLSSKSEIIVACEQIAESVLDQGKKVFILAHYRESVELLGKVFSKFNPALIYGGSSNNEAQKRKFLEDDSCRVCVANYVSGGVGLNLQSVCSDAICAEPTTVPGQFDQACDRLHRSGQVNSVNIYILKAKGTIFVKAVSDMLKKRDLNATVVRPVDLIGEILGQYREVEQGEVLEMRSQDSAELAMARRP